MQWVVSWFRVLRILCRLLTSKRMIGFIWGSRRLIVVVFRGAVEDDSPATNICCSASRVLHLKAPPMMRLFKTKGDSSDSKSMVIKIKMLLTCPWSALPSSGLTWAARFGSLKIRRLSCRAVGEQAAWTRCRKGRWGWSQTRRACSAMRSPPPRARAPTPVVMNSGNINMK